MPVSNVMSRVEALAIRAPADVRRASETLRAYADELGLVVAPWHDLASGSPIRDEDGEIVCESVFGWRETSGWWRAMTNHTICPLADLCRYVSEPFWCDHETPLTSTIPLPRQRRDRTDVSWLWDRTDVRSVLVVPVHMHMGRVGFVAYMSQRPGYDFRPLLGELYILSRTYLTGYDQALGRPDAWDEFRQLSPREIECLTWAFDGKTDRDIALLMDRSYAMVRAHLVSVAEKLGTVNRAQTLARAAALGYLLDRTAVRH